MRWYFLHLLCFACAMFTKETASCFLFSQYCILYSLKGKKIFSITTVLFLVGWGIVLFNWHILRSASMVAPIGNKLQAATLFYRIFGLQYIILGKYFGHSILHLLLSQVTSTSLPGLFLLYCFSSSFFFPNEEIGNLLFLASYGFSLFLSPHSIMI